MRRRGLLTGATIAAAVVVFAAAFALTPPRGPRSMRQFDPNRLADLEVRMWQGDYSKEQVRPVARLVTVPPQENHYSWAPAARETLHPGRAAAPVRGLRPDY